jgi:hypothetical protein
MAEFILVAVFMSESTPKLISTAASLLCSLHWDTLKSAHVLMHQSANGSHGILKEMKKFHGEMHIGILVCSVYHAWINNSPKLISTAARLLCSLP